MKRYLICIGILLLCLLQSKAQWAPQTVYTTSDGLINNRTGCVGQDAAGYMWFGTDNGISCYDGRKFRFFPGTDRKFYFAHSALNYYKQYVVMGTAGEGIALCYQNKVVFKRFKNYEQVRINSAIVLNDSTYLVTAIQNKGLLLITKDEAKAVPLPHTFEMQTNEYLNIMQDRHKNIWVGTGNGLIIFPEGNLKKPVIPEQTKGFSINVIKENHKGKIYICGDNQLIATAAHLMAIDSSLQFETIVNKGKASYISINFDKEDNIFLGYDYNEELAIKDIKKKTENINLLLNNNRFAWDIFFDREENLWLATENGIVKIPQLSTGIFSAAAKEYPACKSGIQTKDGSFMGITGNSVYLINENNFKRIEVQKEILPGYLEERLFETSDGQLWMSNYDSIYAPKITTRSVSIQGNKLIAGKKINHYGGPEMLNMEIAVSDASGRSYFVNEDGDLWIYEDHKFAPVADPAAKGTFHNIKALCTDKKGKLWAINNRKGLMQIAVTQTGKNYTAQIQQCIPVDSTTFKGQKKILCAQDERIWVINSFKKGILIFKKNHSGQYFLSDSIDAEKLSSYMLRDICEDSEGNIYVGSNLGIDKISTKKDGAFEIQKSLFSTDLNGSFVYYLHCINDILFVGTTGSITRIDLKKYTAKKIAPQVYITGLLINNTNSDSLLGQKHLLVLEASQNTLQFTFTAPSFINEKLVKYKYILEGASKEWSLPDHNYSAVFSQLQPGKYTFKVMAQNATGVRSSSPASFSFIIRPPFYLRWWFILLAVATGVSFIYWLYRIQIAKALAIDKTRQKISKDLHDDVGSTLSSITLMNALLRKKIKSNPDDAVLLAEKVEGTSRSMIQNISDIVWSTNPENDSVEKLEFRLRQFAADVFEPKNIAYKLVFDKEMLRKDLNMDVKHDLFLICKEIINNAAKYSAANHFSISFSYKNHTIFIDTEDDGTGMDLTQKIRGNGLANIRQRVKNHKGNAELISTPSEGTQWKIQIPV